MINIKKIHKIIIIVCFLVLSPMGIKAEMNWLDYGMVDVSTIPDSKWKLFAGDPAIYFGTTNNPIIAKWEPVICPTGCVPCTVSYELEIFNVELEKTTNFGIINTNQYEFKLPKTGHYILKVRAVNVDIPTTDLNYASDWAISSDKNYTEINGQPSGFWIYGSVGKPGDIIFNFARKINPFN